MKRHLNKEICEHERRGSSRGFSDERHARRFAVNDDGDNVPSFEGMKKRYGYETKEFGENLSPLWGAVRKAEGRPWNKFYSELCENFDMRSVINQHITLHLEQHVATKTKLVNGEVHVMTYRDFEPLKDSYCEYFVHPETGILCKNKHFESYRQIAKERKKKAAEELKSVERVISKTEVLRKIGDTWFIFTLLEIPKGEIKKVKPNNQILFKNDEGEEVYWVLLSPSEKEKLSIEQYCPTFVTDIFFDCGFHFDIRGKEVKEGRWVNYEHNFTRPLGFYHASRKTASHKELKKAKII